MMSVYMSNPYDVYGFELHIPDQGVMTAVDVMPGSAIADLLGGG